jgi:hypothetical protein
VAKIQLGDPSQDTAEYVAQMETAIPVLVIAGAPYTDKAREYAQLDLAERHPRRAAAAPSST